MKKSLLGIWFKIRKPLICGFILLHAFLMIGGSLPDPNLIMERTLGLFAPYQQFISFQQGWSMFAPFPGGENSYVDATVDFSDGERTVWTFPRPTDMGFVEKSLVGEKYRKLGQERLLPYQNFELWNDVSKFVIQDLNQKFPNREVANIQFFRHSNIVESPEKSIVSHGVRTTNYDTQSIFEYKLPLRVGHEAKNNR